MSVDPRIDAFDECLQRVLNGESPEHVLARYPQWAAEFQPMLEAALATRLLRTVQVPKASIARSRARLLNAAQNRKQPKRFGWIFPKFRLGVMSVVLVLVLLFGSISTMAVSAQTLPGDTLYPLKILTEQTRLFFTKDPSQRLNLERAYDRQRIDEVGALIENARSGRVTFAGGLLQFNTDLWLVDDIPVQIVAGTQIIGQLRQGYYVGVEGILQADGIVLAQKIWTREFQVNGVIERLAPDEWQVDDVTFAVGPETALQGLPYLGAQVTVYLAMRPDGTYEAQTITVISPPPASVTPEPSLTPRPSVTPRPTDTNVPVPTRTPKPSETEKPKDDGGDDEQEETDAPEPSETPKPTDDDDDDGDDDDDDGDDDEHEDEEITETPRPTRTPRPTDHDDDDDDDDHEYESGTPTNTGTVYPTRTPRPTDDDDD
jgi:hypothetical protein